jgi:hypothetical protein
VSDDLELDLEWEPTLAQGPTVAKTQADEVDCEAETVRRIEIAPRVQDLGLEYRVQYGGDISVTRYLPLRATFADVVGLCRQHQVPATLHDAETWELEWSISRMGVVACMRPDRRRAS